MQDRRRFLATLAGATGCCLLSPREVNAETESDEFAECVAMLNDLTRCMGCRNCQGACKNYYDLPHTGDDPKTDSPLGLEATNYTVIKKFVEGRQSSYIKRQCMHCNFPSCASACPVNALTKQKNGAVTYDPEKCIGCRYCMVACPFNVPRFEWDNPKPEIRKCQFCYDRIANNEEPICAKVCPTGAISYGKRFELIEEANHRILAAPTKYIEHIYGERETGGTSVMYLSAVPFDKLGLRHFDDKPLHELAENIQHGMFKWFVSPIALLGLLSLIRLSNIKCDPDDETCIEE